jgi:hypothetical protein
MAIPGFAIPVPPMQKSGEPINIPVLFFDDFVTVSGPLSAATDTTASQGKFGKTQNRGHWFVNWFAGLAGQFPSLDDNTDGGHIRIASAGGAGNHLAMHLNGEAFMLKAGRRAYFETRIKFSNNNNARMFVGFGTGQGNTIDPISDNKPANHVAIMLDGVADSFGYRTGAGGTTGSFTDMDSPVAIDKFYTLAIEYTGTGMVIFYVDGVEKAHTTSNVPDGSALTVIICVESSDSLSQLMHIDYVLAMAERA